VPVNQARFIFIIMAEETAPSSSGKSLNSIDLDALSGLNFGPDWADGKSTGSSKHKSFEEHGAHKGKGRRSGPPPSSSRDRRSGGRPQASRSDRNQDRGGAHPRRDAARGNPAPTFEPTVKIDLFPQDEAFDALVKRLRTSARTYQLFEIAHLLLEKPERFVAVVTPLKHKAVGETTKPLLYYSVPGHLPFETEEQAINYVLQEQIDLFFDIEEIEVDPPKGNFLMVNRCSITGELLGPPNYHRYQEFAQRHYATRISGMSFERFQSKIVGSKEEEDINAWVESMKKGARYNLKDRQEGEPESFETLESARRFLVTHRKDKIVGSGESIRFAGRDIERMPKGNIRQSVEGYIEQQKHFPLDSANNIRGRLRRHKFAVYKKGSKGVSYVCAVKRKFRDSKTIFTDSIRDLIDFIEQHPEIPASKLPNEYIGIDIEKQKPAALEMKEVVAESPSTAHEAETTAEATENPEPAAEQSEPLAEQPEAPAEASVSLPESPESSTGPSDTPDEPTECSPETSETSETSETPETPVAPLPAAVETSTQAKPKSALSDEDQKKLNQLMLDLRWLIIEGYVTEYGNGCLFAPAPLPGPSKKIKDPKVEKPGEKVAPAVADESPVEPASPAEPASPVEPAPPVEPKSSAEPASSIESEPLAGKEALADAEGTADAAAASALDAKKSPKDLS
jgi:hypothetical protein